MTDSPDRVYVGRIFTGSRAMPWAEAVAIGGARVVAIGRIGDVLSQAPQGVEVIELGSRLMSPAFEDAHIHVLEGSLFYLDCDLHDIPAEGYAAAVATRVAELPDGAWLRGGGWSMAAFGPSGPLAQDLDVLTGDRPAYLTARDGHSAWVNTAVLQRAGIDAHTPDPDGGIIVRDERGNPTGTLHETAMKLASRLLPAYSPQDRLQAILMGQQRLLEAGITGWCEARVDPDMIPVWRDFASHGDRVSRVSLAQHWNPALGMDQLDGILAAREEFDAANGVAASSVKLFVDGILENGTAALHESYCGCPGERGRPLFTPEEVNEVTRACASHGLQMHFHAIGDRAVSMALDACEAARRDSGDRDLRHQIAHIQVVRPSELSRFAALGVLPNAQALWACRDEQMTSLCLPALGPERGDWQYPFRSLVSEGAALVMGSDWRVSSFNPLEQIQVAVTRQPLGSPHSDPLVTDQRLDVMDAMLAFTSGSARANHHEDSGELLPGMLADYVILDRDPFSVPASEIADITVMETAREGRIVFSNQGEGARV